MKKAVFIIPILVFVFISCAKKELPSTSKAISHEQWTALLQKHVDELGHVNYQGFKNDSLAFGEYLQHLSSHHPNKKNWNSNERKAYWINAYNAFTVKLIVDNYPVSSIKDLGGALYKINTPWDIRFIEIEGIDYDLNNIEHDILREEWKDARIHFAINCASVSCPKLSNTAYESSKLEAQLNQAAIAFINDSTRNSITPEKARISRIFKWFSGDFIRDLNLISFINQFSSTQLNDDCQIEYQEYKWDLND